MFEALSPTETGALRQAVGFMTAGEADGVPARTVATAENAADKLARAPARTVWIPLSRGEIVLLWAAITNGAEGVLQPSSGYSAAQKSAFRKAANRVADAAELLAARF